MNKKIAIIFGLSLCVVIKSEAGNFLTGPKSFYNTPQESVEESQEQAKAHHEATKAKALKDHDTLKASHNNQDEIASDENSTDANESLYSLVRSLCHVRQK